MMTVDRLKSLLEFNPNTGVFNWIKKNGKVAGCTSRGYVLIKIDGFSYPAHRLVWLLEHGEFPEDCLDHINHDRSDNRLVNLREVSRNENSKNKSLHSNNTSGVSGVTWNENAKRWQAQIKVDRKLIYLGVHIQFSEAVDARKNAEVLYGFHTNHGEK